MKLVTWNINSIRARTDRLLAWIDRERPDVLCLQETKVEDAAFPADGAARRRLRGRDLRAAELQRRRDRVDPAARPTWPADSATASRTSEARVIAATTHGVRVVCRLRPERPGSRVGSVSVQARLVHAAARATSIAPRRPADDLVVCGDMNVTADDRDVWSPAEWKDQIHCSAAERAALAEVRAFGLIDVFREAPARRAACTRGGTTAGSRSSRTRACASTTSSRRPRSTARCTACTIDRTARKGQDASDHAPVIGDLRSLAARAQIRGAAGASSALSRSFCGTGNAGSCAAGRGAGSGTTSTGGAALARQLAIALRSSG